jgi:hypothetical protein
MKVSLVEEKQNINSKKRLQYVSNSDIKEVRKICPWAILTYPYKEGHMAFETVSVYNEWLKQK